MKLTLKLLLFILLISISVPVFAQDSIKIIYPRTTGSIPEIIMNGLNPVLMTVIGKNTTWESFLMINGGDSAGYEYLLKLIPH